MSARTPSRTIRLSSARKTLIAWPCAGAARFIESVIPHRKPTRPVLRPPGTGDAKHNSPCPASVGPPRLHKTAAGTARTASGQEPQAKGEAHISQLCAACAGPDQEPTADH